MAIENKDDQLPSVQEAQDTLFQRAYAEAFLNRMSELGYRPANQKQAQAKLELGGRLVAVEEMEMAKQAGDGDFYSQTLSDLDAVLASKGGQTQDRAREERAMKIVAEIARDSDVYRAIVALAAAAREEQTTIM